MPEREPPDPYHARPLHLDVGGVHALEAHGRMLRRAEDEVAADRGARHPRLQLRPGASRHGQGRVQRAPDGARDREPPRDGGEARVLEPYVGLELARVEGRPTVQGERPRAGERHLEPDRHRLWSRPDDVAYPEREALEGERRPRRLARPLGDGGAGDAERGEPERPVREGETAGGEPQARVGQASDRAGAERDVEGADLPVHVEPHPGLPRPMEHHRGAEPPAGEPDRARRWDIRVGRPDVETGERHADVRVERPGIDRPFERRAPTVGEGGRPPDPRSSGRGPGEILGHQRETAEVEPDRRRHGRIHHRRPALQLEPPERQGTRAPGETRHRGPEPGVGHEGFALTAPGQDTLPADDVAVDGDGGLPRRADPEGRVDPAALDPHGGIMREVRAE